MDFEFLNCISLNKLLIIHEINVKIKIARFRYKMTYIVAIFLNTFRFKFATKKYYKFTEKTFILE